MRFEVLGPLRVTGAEGELPLGGPKQRLVMALLIAARGRPVSTSTLIDGVWGEEPPATARKALQGYVHHLRAQVGEVLVTESNGYSLRTDDNVDAIEFEQFRRESAQVSDADAARASELLRTALELWTARAYADLADEPALVPEIARLEDLRIGALGDRIDADLALGRHRALIGELEGLVHEYPLQERFRAQHMTALFRAGRQVEALRSFERHRRYLGDEMGLGPSRELIDLEGRILADDDELRAVEPAGSIDPVAVRGYELRDVIAATPSGRTYCAYQRSVGRQVKVKMLTAEIADDPQFIADFRADTKLVGALGHAHIDIVFDTWREPGAAYQVSRWFDRGSAADLLVDGRPSVAAALQIIGDVADALGHAHRNDVVHGHVAASNVMLDDSGRAYLSDFVVGRDPERTAERDRHDLAVLARTLFTSDTGDSPSGIDDVLALALGDDGYRQPEHLARALRQALGVDGVAPVAAPAKTETRNPYKGLRAFQELDAADFFGRDQMLDRLMAELNQHRLVGVVGPSGSGKSSMVKAGLLPRLRGLDDGTIRLVAEMFPGAYPFEDLEDALLSVGVGRTNLIDDLLAGDRGLARVLRQVLPADNAELVLVIDQFEELFSMVEDEQTRQLFLDSLVAAANDPRSALRVIVTMRADFFDRPLRYPEFGALLDAALVPLTVPDEAGLALAVTEPAAALGVDFEAGLVDTIVQDVAGQPGSLPLLQYALTELFEARETNTITLAAYRRGGGVSGALGRRAEQLFGDLHDQGRAAIRHALLHMASVENADDVRRRVRRADLRTPDIDDSAIDQALQLFGAHRLVTFDLDPATSTPTVEVAHEALMREWPRLRGWIEEQRDDLIVRRRLAIAVAEWKAAGEDDSFLPSGSRLAQFEEWSRTTTLAIGVEDLAFLESAVERRNRERDAEQRRVRRLRRLVGVVGVALVLALIAGGLAFRQQRRADDEADAARAAAAEADVAALIARSAAQQTRDSELSILLALEAHRRSPRPDTEQAVLNALGAARSPSRIAVGSPLDTTECRAPAFTSIDASKEYGIIDGRLLSLEFDTGEITDHGRAHDDCGVWLGDPASNRVMVNAVDVSATWVGTFDDPYAVELDLAGPAYVLPTDLGSGVVALVRVADGPPRLRLFDATTGEPRGEPLLRGQPLSVVAHPSGSYAAASFEDLNRPGTGSISIIDGRDGDELFVIETPAVVFAMAIDGETDELVVGTAEGRLMTFDLATGDLVADVPTNAASGVGQLDIRPDGLLVIVAGDLVEVVDRRSGPTGDITEIGEVLFAHPRRDDTVLTYTAIDQYAVIELQGSALVERTWPVDPAARIAIDAGQAGAINTASQTTEVVDLDSGERSEIGLLTPDGSPFVAIKVYPEPNGVWAVAAEGVLARWTEDRMVERVELPGPHFASTRFGDMIAVLGLDDATGQTVAQLVNLEHGDAGVVLSVPVAIEAVSVHPARDGGIHVFESDGTMLTYDRAGALASEIETGAQTPLVSTIDPASGAVAILSQAWPAAVIVIDPATAEVTRLPDLGAVANFGFARNGQLLVITMVGGDVTVWDLERGESAGLVWDGAESYGTTAPSWYDESTDSMWVFTSDRLIEIPLDPDVWVERACAFVGRDLSTDEWDLYVPGDLPPRSASA